MRIARAWLSCSLPTLAMLSCLPGVLGAGDLASDGVPSQLLPPTYADTFAPEVDYDPAVPDPASLLGDRLGARPATGDEILRACEAIAAASPRVKLEHYGRTHESRPLVYLIVTAPQQMARLEAIRSARDEVAWPARAQDGERLAQQAGDLPPVVWIGGSVHGGEASGADAALALLHHLAADRSAATQEILARTIVLIDPLENPDGRARFTADRTSWGSRIPVTDRQSMQHRRGWPSARGNHYLLDLNRDWFALSQPETRGRIRVLVDWQPQVTIDLHEMGAFDSYLFSPPRAPYNPHMPATTHTWWQRFSIAQATAFGAHGWSCYTGDWNEEFNPNRGASWPLFAGAVALLGEQSTTKGGSVRHPDGRVLTYREAVHHQFTAALTLIESVAAAPQELMQDYVRGRIDNLSPPRHAIQSYIISAESRPELAERLALTLTAQGIEVEKSRADFTASGARSYWGEKRGKTPFPAGTYVVQLAQPQGRLARAILDFDTPLGDDFLSRERQRRERGEPTLLYESSAWSLAMAYGVETLASTDRVRVDASPVEARDADPASTAGRAAGVVHGPRAAYGFLLDPLGPGAARALAALHNTDIRCWGAAEPFHKDGRRYAAGSVLIKREDHRAGSGGRADSESDLDDRLTTIATRTGADFHGIEHALSTDGPDLGSRKFRLLSNPRVALIGGGQFYQTTFGAIWFWLDRELGLPCALLRISQLAEADLEQYDVIVTPDAAPGRGPDIVQTLGEAGSAALGGWIRRGGTLITLGESNWIAFGGEEPLGNLRARRLVLDELDAYRGDALHQAAVAGLRVDEAALRAGGADAIRGEGLSSGDGSATSAADVDGAVTTVVQVSDEDDERLRRFHPQGAILRADLHPNHWLTAGVDARLPVLVRTDLALLTRHPVETIGRFADTAELRVSGLLWPEARRRWALTTYVCRERIDRGQIISFLGNPVYRGYFHGSARLFSNALLLGPGMGSATRVGY